MITAVIKMCAAVHLLQKLRLRSSSFPRTCLIQELLALAHILSRVSVNAKMDVFTSDKMSKTSTFFIPTSKFCHV